MKGLTLLAASALIATSAMATDAKMKVVGRFDHKSTEEKDTTNGVAATKVNTSAMNGSYLKWTNTAKINETTTAELKLNLTKAQSNNSGNFSDFVDTAFITKSLGMGMSVVVGKQGVLIGGRENDYSSADTYSVSTFTENTPGNSVGLTAAYEMAGQVFNVQYLEANNTTLSNKKVVGVAYYGTFLDGNISPILSYHKIGNGNLGKYDLLAASGVQYKIASFVIEADYLSRTNENGGKTTTGATVDEKQNSIVGHVRYSMDMFNPFFKYILDTDENNSGNKTKVSKTTKSTWELGLEVVPNKEQDMRYHVVYASSEEKDDAGTAGHTTFKNKNTTMYAGIKYGFNLL